MKMQETLYDKCGSRIGTLKKRPDGNIEIYDKGEATWRVQRKKQ